MKKYICFDTETTGLIFGANEVLQFYGEILDENLETLSKIELFCKPESGNYQVVPAALAINKIDLVGHDKKAKGYGECSGCLETFLEANKREGKKKLIPLGQNFVFDILMLEGKFPNFSKYWSEVVDRRGIDTTAINIFLKDAGLLEEECPSSLSGACEFLGIDNKNAHEAKMDVSMSKMVYKKYLELTKKK
jgi:DNA polymerase III alpha subunit (gram-positive type)